MYQAHYLATYHNRSTWAICQHCLIGGVSWRKEDGRENRMKSYAALGEDDKRYGQPCQRCQSEKGGLTRVSG